MIPEFYFSFFMLFRKENQLISVAQA
jgi:hypothetical protein